MMLSLSPWNAGLSEIVGLWIGLGMWTGALESIFLNSIMSS